MEDKPQMSPNEKQQMNQELFIRCIAPPLGFSGNKLIAACIVYVSCIGDHLKLRVQVPVLTIVSSKLVAMQLRYEKQNLLMVMRFFLLLFLTYYFQVPGTPEHPKSRQLWWNGSTTASLFINNLVWEDDSSKQSF
ncbi:myosin-H heavy chain-like protein [Trifolium pratense]|uniref:Myosin-H heavy chain-like protein n=1 Tax=Trifolium pratense TaxID=57577 RepID=A0A2K3NW93_TRIPR|nr:myosin-H heavy chain-like protein [Trifolium pratense]